jgi:acetyl esterase
MYAIIAAALLGDTLTQDRPKVVNRRQVHLCELIPPRLSGMRRPDSIDGAKSYVYAHTPSVDLRLHVFEPKAPAQKRAAIVFFFGGGWTWGTVDQFVPEAKYFADRGMVSIVADYRLLCRDNTTPFESVVDAKAAIAWVRSHAQELRVDPDRIAASGESAGAQLALMAAIDGNKASRPSALVLYSAPVTILDNHGWMEDRFGTEIANQVRSISPLENIHKDLPPTLILNGRADTTTPFDLAHQYCTQVAALGNACTLIGVEGADHGFFNPPGYPAKHAYNGRWFASGLWETDAFLTNLSYTYNVSP